MRISLNISIDNHRYFDQYRTFEAIAHGALVLSNPVPNLEQYGFIEDIHLVTCNLGELQEYCANLLWNNEFRARIVTNAQQLLRERYTLSRIAPKVLALCEQII